MHQVSLMNVSNAKRDLPEDVLDLGDGQTTDFTDDKLFDTFICILICSCVRICVCIHTSTFTVSFFQF